MAYAKVSGGAVKMHTTQYSKFRGVDFSTDPASVSRERSPMAPNLISDASGYPEKRPGWRALHDYGATIRGIHRIVINGAEHILIHAGKKIYKHGTVPAELYTAAATSGLSTSVVFAGKLWILTGAEYLCYDGSSVAPVTSAAHVPTVFIGCKPLTGAGTAYEPVNLLSANRIKSYVADGTAAYLTEPSITGIVEVKVNGTATTGYTVNTSTGVVTFSSAPSAPSVAGQDNVTIEYAKTVTGYADKINKCRFMGLFGLGGMGSDRIFFSGNPDSPNVDWHCDIAAPDYEVDPSYIPDTSYAHIGSPENPIMGYRRLGSYQLIIKGQNDQDASVFQRSAALDTEGNTMFGIEQGAAGIGAESMHCFANLADEPLFLSKQGIFGIYSTNVLSITALQNRSYFVDKLLTAESNLDKAVGAEWNGYYVLCVNNRAYVLDGRQRKQYNEKSGSAYVYECYYWTNIPAVCMREVDGILYFGTADGLFCRFNTDISDSTMYNDNGTAIDAFWSTRLDDDGSTLLYKTTIKIGITMKPDTLSSVKVYVTTQKNSFALANTFTYDSFDFSDIDFADFSFMTGGVVQTVPLRYKVKKYISLQITARNDIKDESFGICKIEKVFITGSYVRTPSGGVLT